MFFPARGTEPKNKTARRGIGVYWRLAKTIFFTLGFYKGERHWMGWRYAVLLWPIAGVLFGALMFLQRRFYQKRKRDEK